MAHIVRGKHLRILIAFAYGYAVLLFLAWALDISAVVDLSLHSLLVLPVILPVLYYWFFFKRTEKHFGRRNAYIVGIALTIAPMLLVAISTGSYVTLFVNSGLIMLLIFLSAMVGPSVPVGLVWVIGVGYLVAFSGHIPSVEAVRLTIMLLGAYVIAVMLGWLVFRRLYIREDPELEQLRKTLRGEQLKSEGVIAAINDGVAIVDHDGVAIHANDKFFEILALKKDELINKHYGDVINSRLRIIASNTATPRIGKNIAEVFKTGQPMTIDTMTVEYVDGRGIYDYSVSILPLKNEEGDLTAVMVIIRDITNLMKLQRMKDALIATASHELRTPITVIAGYADLLLGNTGEALTEKQRHYLERTRETTAHLTQMVNDMLDISRLESNQRDDKPVPLSVHPILEAIIEDKLSLFAGKQLSLHLEASEAKIFADEGRFRQVVANLISNAYKFTPEGGKVMVTGESIGDNYRIAVTDTGPGIPEDRMQEIFEKFTKLDDTGAIPGTGLGLAIAKNIVATWGGTITVKNMPEGGANFSFTVPLAKDISNNETEG